jgi:hypothetical protein
MAVLLGSVALACVPVGADSSMARSAAQQGSVSTTGAPAGAGTGLRPQRRDGSPRVVAAVAVGEAAATDPRTDQQVVSDASDEITALSRFYGEEAHRRAAVVLEDLALLARRLDGTAGTIQDSTRVSEEARALTNGKGYFKGADRTREGLLASLDALRFRSASSAVALTPWITSARAAVESIGAGSAFDLERPAMQDAFRAVLDCYRLAVLLAPR